MHEPYGRGQSYNINMIITTLAAMLLRACGSEHVQYRIRRGEIPMRGVNLGGWLLAEHWMTWDSGIWEGVPQQITNQGEFKTMQFLGHAVGDQRFDQHRQTFITEKDIQEIAAAGLNSVRVPIGYWIIGYDNYDISGKREWEVLAPGALKYLDLLVKKWGNDYNVAVLVDIHAAKGSQNGNDHSAPPDPGHSYWAEYPENVANTIEVADFIYKRYEKEPCFLGIGLLNEPAGNTNNATLRNYFKDAYTKIRGQGTNILLGHAPLLWEQNHFFWADFAPPPAFTGFIHEWHKYLVWGYEGWSVDRLINEGLPGIKNDIAQWKGNWLFIGEWSVATDQYISDSSRFREFVKLYFDALREAHAGYTYWTWKISGDEKGTRQEWSFRNLYRSGYILKSYYQV